MPYFIHGDLKFTETLAIHKYVADQWKPECLGKTAAEKAQVNMCSGVLLDIKMGTTMPCYMSGDVEKIKECITAKMPAIVAFLGDKKFLVGDYATYVDFYFFELLNTLNFYTEGKVYTDYPTLSTYHASVADLPGLKEYLADPNCMENTRTFNGKSAKLNNTV